MSDETARGGEQELMAVVGEARARLRRIAGREHLREKGWWVLGAGAAVAAARPWTWRLAAEAPLWTGIGRALVLFAAGATAAAIALVLLGRRRGPTEIGAARAVDEALGTQEVIASGFAFAKGGRAEPVVMIARKRAAEQAAKVKVGTGVRALFPLPSLRPSARAAAVFAACATMAVSAGGYERGLANALIAPPTMNERQAAAALEEVAAAMAEQPAKDAKEPGLEKPAPKRDRGNDKLGAAGPALADKAKEAARAARRGDRKGAMEKLEELRSAGSQRSAEAGDLKAALRKLAEALSPPPSGEKRGASAGAARPEASGKDASESMKLLAEKIRQPEAGGAGSGNESNERVLERLERAAEEARRAGEGGKNKEANEAARALSRAAEAMRRGDREAASQALSQAAERAAAMEQARAEAAAEAMAIAEMLDRSGELERAIQLAMLGREGQGESEGQGEGQGQGKGQGQGADGKDGEGTGKGDGGKPGGRAAALRRAILARLAAMGAGDAPQDHDGSPGSGPHQPDRQRSKRAALPVQGSMRAPGQVGEGPRAIQAISGLGKGTEPPAEYREVFPTYDAAVEEGLADERIPAQRRAAVRRYFQSIRPEQGK